MKNVPPYPLASINTPPKTALPDQPNLVRSQLMDLFKMDLILADFENNTYTLNASKQRHPETNPDSEYELCSDRMLRKFPGYHYDAETRIVPGESIQTNNLMQVKEMLLSTDMSSYEQIQ